MLRLGAIAFTLIISYFTLLILDHLMDEWKEIANVAAFYSNR